MDTILVTGAAGFIGFHLGKRLLSEGYNVCGIDNLNSYYDIKLKESRLAQLEKSKGFASHRIDLVDSDKVEFIFQKYKIKRVIHLAAQAGVRYSIENPYAYLDSNIYGFLNILEACKKYKTENLIFASSSSVYGANKKIPFSENDIVDNPVSVYAATKKANELLAYTYSTMTETAMVGLRFFTVYGEWGRPDMAYFSFTKNILENVPINIYNNGDMMRDFTYIDDIVDGIVRILKTIELSNNSNTRAQKYQIFNIGNNQPVKLIDFIETIEQKLGITAIKNYLPMQMGDVPITFADINKLKDYCGFNPKTSIKVGLGKFIDWYVDYYHITNKNMKNRSPKVNVTLRKKVTA